jgi:hypothetical protein
MPLYTKEDLAKLKDSKPIPIIAHTHECIVPVVYSGMVNRFLESKGVHLPLTHHQLADMKREAGTSGYAKGTHNLQAQKVSQKVIIHLGEKKKARRRRATRRKGFTGGKPEAPRPAPQPAPSGSQALYNQLRPDNYSMIRPLSTQVPQIFQQRDFGKEAKEAKAVEQAALDKYKAELDQRKHQMEELEKSMKEVQAQKAPLYKPADQIPLRANDFDQLPTDIQAHEREAALRRYLDREVGRTMKAAKKAAAKQKQEDEKQSHRSEEPILLPLLEEPAQPAVSAPEKKKRKPKIRPSLSLDA